MSLDDCDHVDARITPKQLRALLKECADSAMVESFDDFVRGGKRSAEIHSARVDFARKAIAAGATYDDVAILLNTSLRWARRWGVEAPPCWHSEKYERESAAKMKVAGVPNKEIAKRMGVSIQTIVDWFRFSKTIIEWKKEKAALPLKYR